MRILKNVLAQLHRFVLWALVLTLFWTWIYTSFVGETTRDKKVVLFIDAYALEPRKLALRLEDEGLPAGIRMIQVRSFDYDFLGGQIEGDIYLARASVLQSKLEQAPDSLAPIRLPEGMEGYVWEGRVYGIRVFDVDTQHGPGESYIQYTPIPEPSPESYYLCFDANSPHLLTQPNAVDNAAWEVAEHLLALN